MAIFSAILPDFVGRVVTSGRYQLRLLHKVGCGAYGVVYLARDLSTQEDNPTFFAVKCMLKHEPESDLEFAQKREIVYHKHMSHHPNITKLHEVITDAHYVYIVMDFYEGGDLFGAIIDRRSFHYQDDNVRRGFVQLLDAVEACHQAGIYHRDLKPENIMCSHGDIQIFLSDFGLATQTVASNSFGCGSAYYMSPGEYPPSFVPRFTHGLLECIGETSRSVPYSTRISDVWALGVILTNIITQHNPWYIASVTLDEGYAQYIREGEKSLPHILPVSLEAGHILARTFDPNPKTRITIPELRRAVLAVHTFFPPDDAIDHSQIYEVSLEASTNEGSGSFMDIPLEAPQKPPTSLTPFVSTPHVEITTSAFVNGNSWPSAYSSDAESVGPVTPVTRAIESSTAVPRLVLEDKHVVDVCTAVQVPEPAKVHNNIPKRVRRFMGAIHRIF